MIVDRKDIRLALPSKGRLAEAGMRFLTEVGLRVHKPNPRQFEATVPALPGLADAELAHFYTFTCWSGG